MSQTFFFYDLETSGLNARNDRIMQFAGIRTDMDLNPIGDPYNILVKLSDDILPSPEALLVTGITPQQTLQDGYSEPEFARLLYEEIFTPNTITIGFNSIRFDDEFIRHLFWRNFYDAYEWAWKDGRSRWDLLDVVRITRALRPEGIEWPVDGKGQATNRLELITKLNGIDHTKAHDALSDVEALISVSKLIKDKQPQLFDYLFKMRDKNAVKQLVNLDDKKPFVYVSGRYDAEYNKATVAFPLTAGKNGNVVVYDLRHDPTVFMKMSEEELSQKFSAPWEERRSKNFVALPVKEMQYNRAPAVAPLGVLSQNDGWKKVGLDEETIKKHTQELLKHPEFAEKIRTIFENREEFKPAEDAEGKLYDGFIPEVDRMRMEIVRNADSNALADFHPNFVDDRLDDLLFRYKARNFPDSLSGDERNAWDKWRAERLTKIMPSYLKTIERLSTKATDNQELFILQEMHLWAESIMPSDDSQMSLLD